MHSTLEEKTAGTMAENENSSDESKFNFSYNLVCKSDTITGDFEDGSVPKQKDDKH